MVSHIKRLFCYLLMLSIVCLGAPVMPAQAAMVTTADAQQSATTSADRERLNTLLARADVQQRLLELGVDPAEVKLRVASLTDREVAQLNDRFDQLHPGGDFVGAVIGAAVVIFLVLLITDILGLTDVFSFVKHH